MNKHQKSSVEMLEIMINRLLNKSKEVGKPLIAMCSIKTRLGHGGIEFHCFGVYENEKSTPSSDLLALTLSMERAMKEREKIQELVLVKRVGATLAVSLVGDCTFTFAG